MASSTTSLSSLPTNNQNTPNINLTVNESNSSLTYNPKIQIDDTQQLNNQQIDNISSQFTPPPQPPAPTSTTQIQDMSPQNQEAEFKKMLNDIENASNKGMTQMPSKDIDQSTTHIVNDTSVIPDFIPNVEKYIDNEITVDDVINTNNTKESFSNTFDYYFDEISNLIVVFLLSFLIQLPIASKTIKRMIPSLFNEDGNIKLYGIIFKSLIFCVSYYGLIKLINF